MQSFEKTSCVWQQRLQTRPGSRSRGGAVGCSLSPGLRQSLMLFSSGGGSNNRQESESKLPLGKFPSWLDWPVLPSLLSLKPPFPKRDERKNLLTCTCPMEKELLLSRWSLMGIPTCRVCSRSFKGLQVPMKKIPASYLLCFLPILINLPLKAFKWPWLCMNEEPTKDSYNWAACVSIPTSLSHSGNLV